MEKMVRKNIHIAKDAQKDLESGWAFYERQSPGIGEYFWDSLISDIESLTLYAGIHAKVYGYYRMTSKRFPYSIYYDLDGSAVYIVAILPERSNPLGISDRLE